MKRRTWWIDLGILALYVAISLGASYPLLLHLGDQVAGRHMDARVFQWNDWWVSTALRRGLDLYYSDDIYYPSGASLTGHNFNWISSFLALPLRALSSPAVAHNLNFLLTLYLAAFGMYLLARELTGRRDAAFVAGLVFAFAPYHISGNWSGQLNLANVQWLPLFALFAWRTVRHRLFRDAVLSGVFLALASLDCWFFMVFLGMWGVLLGLYALLFDRPAWSWRLLALLAAGGGVFGLLTAPLLWPVIGDLSGGATGDALAYYEDLKSTDVLAFVTPSSDHPLWAQQTAAVYDRFSHWRPAFLGYLPLALALYGALARPRRALLWTFSLLIFAGLALGTVLRVGGVEYPAVPTPYALLTRVIPAFRLVRQANRFNVIVSLALAALVALGCADLLARIERGVAGRGLAQWLPKLVVALTSVVVLFEYLAVPCPTLPYAVSPFYDTLAQEAGDFALVELPLEFLYARRSLYAQTFHGKRVVNGYVARAPADADAFLYSSALLKAFRLRMALDTEQYDLARQIGLLAANDIRYIVIQKTEMPPHPAVEPDVLASWRELLGPNPLYEDDQILVYPTALASGQRLDPLLRFEGGLAVIDVRARRTRLLQEQFLTVDLDWRAMADLEQDYACRLALYAAGGSAPVAMAGSQPPLISPEYPTARWREGVVVSERYALPLDPALAGGEYELQVAIIDPDSGAEVDVRRNPVAVGARAAPFTPSLAEVPHPVDATFGGALWLLGYDGRREGDLLWLDVYWQVLRTLDDDYKVFVHLIDPADGTIVAQQDAMPRGWSYPTSLWSRQEVFVDRLPLNVSGVEPGRYQLALGIYRPGLGRLPARDAHGEPVPDDRVTLSREVAIE